MDDCDLASRYADALYKSALANQLGKGKFMGKSLKSCEDCGEDIPEDRRKAVPGCRRCVRCETEFERKQK